MRLGNVGRRRDMSECKNGKPDNSIPNSNVMNQQMMIPNMFSQGIFVYLQNLNRFSRAEDDVNLFYSRNNTLG